jgi:HSP20 family molecular chaperone IbpA
LHRNRWPKKPRPGLAYRGIPARNFERSFQLADYVEVKGASLENGLLHVDPAREIPEAMKPPNGGIGSCSLLGSSQLQSASA